MKQIHIHFVGSTDQYRSRMAVLYLRRLVPKDWQLTSSGATTSISQKTLDQATVIIFLDKSSYEHALKLLAVDARKTMVWDIATLGTYAKKRGLDVSRSVDHEKAVLVLLEVVKQHCDDLFKSLSAGSWVDVIEKNNSFTGLILPIDWVTNRGLWFRSAHVILMTPRGDFLVEKRSAVITFAPGALDVTLGGIVDAGETPLLAAVRETYEELGIRIQPNQLKRVMITRENSWHPSLKKYSRSVKYVYVAQLVPSQMFINTDPLEVNGVAILSRHELKTLLRTHRARHMGRLVPSYRFYDDAVRQSLKIIKQSKKHK